MRSDVWYGEEYPDHRQALRQSMQPWFAQCVRAAGLRPGTPPARLFRQQLARVYRRGLLAPRDAVDVLYQ